MLNDLVKLRDQIAERPIVNSTTLTDYRLDPDLLKRLTEDLGDVDYGFNRFTSFRVTDRDEQNDPKNFALIPNQYFAYAAVLRDFAVELFKYLEIFHRARPHAAHLLGNETEITNNIKSIKTLRDLFESDTDIQLFSKFLDKDDETARLGSKRLINDKGKPRGAADCFSSVILKVINLPDVSSAVFGKIVFDLCKHPDLYNQLSANFSARFVETISVATVTNPKSGLVRVHKPFILLAGISGTGKTRFVREQSHLHGLNGENFCLVPVRPDWHEPSDLLGYVSRISGEPKYVPTKVLQFLITAWRAVAPNACSEGTGDLQLNSPPFWLCLDEMNLAPVEQYFADYLSALESRNFTDNSYYSDSLLDSTVLARNESFKSDLGLANEEDLWNFFKKFGIGVPPNLIVAGTVNMDETTHGFSRKVIDRAITIDFGEFFPNEYDKFYDDQPVHKVLTYGTKTQAKENEISCAADPGGTKTIQFLNKIQKELAKTPFDIAYRALNEILLSVASFAPNTDQELLAIWDDFVMTKILPRIEGDEDKLQSFGGQGDASILDKLENVLSTELSEIWAEDKTRVDLLRENPDSSTISIPCRSRQKLAWMKDRLSRNTFTSFWP
ncbi:MAG: McrB family protein [Pseudomonadales bacterium]